MTIFFILIAVIVIGVLFFFYFRKKKVEHISTVTPTIEEDDVDDNVKPVKPPKI